MIPYFLNLGILLSFLAPQQGPLASNQAIDDDPRVIIVAEPVDLDGYREAIEIGTSYLGKRGLVKQLDVASLDAQVEDRRGQLCRALRAYPKALGFSARFDTVNGIFHVSGFDQSTGRFAQKGTKVRSVTSGLSEEHRERILGVFQDLLLKLENPEISLEDKPPSREEDRPHAGFAWRYDGANVFVDYVFEGSQAFESGLRAEDRILSVEENSVDSPAHFGRAWSELRPGQSFALGVEREGESQSLALEMITYGQVLSAWEEPTRGKGMPDSVAAEPGKITVVAIVSGRRPQAWEELYSIQWMSEQWSEDVELIGILRECQEKDRDGFIKRFGWGGRWICDENSQISRQLRVDTEPRFLVFDAQQRLRFRYGRGASLIAMVKSLRPQRK